MAQRRWCDVLGIQPFVIVLPKEKDSHRHEIYHTYGAPVPYAAKGFFQKPTEKSGWLEDTKQSTCSCIRTTSYKMTMLLSEALLTITVDRKD